MAKTEVITPSQGSTPTPKTLRKPRRTTKAQSEESQAIVRRVNDDGSVNLAGLTDTQISRYQDIASSLNEHDITSVSTYGSDLQRVMDSNSNAFLSQQLSSQSSVESAKLISDLLCEIKRVDVGDLEPPSTLTRILSHIPLLNRIVRSVEEIRMKYNTIQENIDEIVKKLSATKQLALRDNNELQRQFENNVDYVDQLEELIIAAKIKSEELGRQIEEMKANPMSYASYEIADIEDYKMSLDKRISDLLILRFAFKESLTQIRIIQRSNMLCATNIESQITMTIPLWKNQMSIAVALFNQKQNIEINGKTSDTTNELITKNSEMMKTQAIEVARQSQRSIIDIETLRRATDNLLETVQDIKKVQEEGRAQRAAAEAEMLKLERQISIAASGVEESVMRIKAKELAQVEAK